MIFVISGPSGVGKSFLCKNIIKYLDGFYLPKKHTTRAKRIGEDDFEYFFIDEVEFKQKLINGDFVVHTNIYNNWYGLSRTEISKNGQNHSHYIFILDAFLAQIFKKEVNEATIIFILPTDINELVKHLKSRVTLYNESVNERIELLQSELDQHLMFDFIIPHLNGETSLEILKGIIVSQFCRCNFYTKLTNESLNSYFKFYPKLAVDAVIFDKTYAKILLIERLKEPHGWALPGGFVENRETVEAAIEREVREETGISLKCYKKLGVFSEPNRDPRLHVVSIAFISTTENDAHAGGDAKSANWFNINNIPSNIAFDHEKIIMEALSQIPEYMSYILSH